MKVVHRNQEKEEITFQRARQLEEEGELPGATVIYQKLLSLHPADEAILNRAMIVYRKQKEYKKELNVINAGIKAFEEKYKSAITKGGNKKVASLSKTLLKSMGMLDKKGNELYQKEPIGKWLKRRKVVLGKMKK